MAKPAKHCNNIPSKIIQEIGSYTLIHGAKPAVDRFPKVYIKYSFKRTTVNGWKERCKKNDLHSVGKRGRPNLVDDLMVKKNQRCYHRIRSSRFSNLSENGSCIR